MLVKMGSSSARFGVKIKKIANRHLDVTNNLPPKDDGWKMSFLLGLVVGELK